MALKKSELYSSLWESCNELRGGMDASQYKDYVLVLLFVKYISDKYSGKSYSPITIPAGASFSEMVALKGKADIGDQINKKILAPLAEANGLSDMPDFNDPAKLGDGKEKVERLTNLIAIFENPALDFSNNRADGDDLLGDAYEYLMRHFATESGKSKGQFYTPSEVSRIMAQILGIREAATSSNTTVYDPTCGSGSLLLKIGDEGSRRKGVKVTLYGQEKDNATAGLARMNMILHDYPTAEIKQGNTLANPLFKDGQGLKTFDYVVANPPFSDKRWSTGLTLDSDPYGRFEGFGIPPTKQGDYAYLLHILRSMKSSGKGACILPHGVLFRGNAEAAIRKNLVQRGLIKGIIGLPGNLFYGTPIPACIIFLDKSEAASRSGIFMINASREFRKDGPKNRLREQDIHKIVDTFLQGVDVPGYARMVPISEIADEKNDYTLNLSRYIESTQDGVVQDLEGHIKGGIPNRDIEAIANYWQVIPGVRDALFESAGREGYSRLRVPPAEVKSTVFEHPEFQNFNKSVGTIFKDWKKEAVILLSDFDLNGVPKKLIETLSESLLKDFDNIPLIGSYDVYQFLMDYWDKVMQDDCYLISEVGWKKGAEPREFFQIKNKDGKLSWSELCDFKKGKRRFKSDLIPLDLLVSEYFQNEQKLISSLEQDLAELEDSIKARIDDGNEEDGLLVDVVEGEGDRQKITPKAIKERLKEIKNDPDYSDEMKALLDFLKILDQQTKMKSELKLAQSDLDAKVEQKYYSLSESEIKSLVIVKKWLAALENLLQSQLGHISQVLTQHINRLAETYEVPLPILTKEMLSHFESVKENLKGMGVSWS